MAAILIFPMMKRHNNIPLLKMNKQRHPNNKQINKQTLNNEQEWRKEYFF